MALIQHVWPWDSQPQEAATPAEDLSLTSLILPGLSNRDLISGVRLSTMTGTRVPGTRPSGRVLVTGSTRFSIHTTAPVTARTPSASIVWTGDLDTRSVAEFPTLFGLTHSNANSSPFVALQIKRRAALLSDSLFLAFNTGGTGRQITSSSNYLSGPVVIVGVVQSGRQVFAIRSGTGVEWLTASFTGSIAYGASPRLEVGDSLNNRSSDSAVSACALAGRAWCDADVLRVLENRWAALFAPRLIHIPTASAGPSLPTLSLSAAVTGSITSTGWRPQVNTA